MSKRPDRFVVGLLGVGGPVWGGPQCYKYKYHAEPMTLAQARQEIDRVAAGEWVVYELVVKETRRPR